MSIQTAVDTARTFSVLIYMSCEPKADFNTGEHQTNRDGLFKWGVSIAAQTKPRNGQRSQAETITVTIASATDPCDGIDPGTPVELVDMWTGSMDPEMRGDKIRGGRPFFQASGVRPLVAPRMTS